MKTGVLFFIILLSSSHLFSQWTRTNGPEGISMGSLLSVGNTVYAGTETDGVYASTNDGINWFPVNSGIETEGIGALAHKSGYLFAGTNGHGVYRSTNGGQTWLPPSNENSLYVNSIAVKDSYVFASSNGTFRSSDNGVTWVYVGYDTEFFHSLCVDGNKLFEVSSSGSYVSTNDGTSWTPLNISLNLWSLYSNGNFVIAGGDSQVFISTDQGNNFTTVNIPFNFSVVNFYAITAIGSTLFAGTSYDGVYKSTNNGYNWTPVKSGMGPKNIQTLTVTGSSSLIAGAEYSGVYRSANSGNNWSRSMAGFPAGSTISGLFASGSTVLAGTYDGMFRSLDNGLNWNKLTGNSDTVNYALVRGLWESGDTIFEATIYQYHSTVYKSTDNGTTWKWSGNGISTAEQFINAVIKSGNNVLAGSSHGVYYSSDGGNNWILANGLNAYVLGLAKGGGWVYASTDYDVYRSSDDGVNWIHAVGAFDFTSIGAIDNFACVGSFEGGAVTTTDNGALWFNAGGIPGGASVYSAFYVPNQTGMVMASTNINGSRIYTSFNDGLSFFPYSDGLSVNAVAEYFTATDTFLIAGMDFNGVWRRPRPGFVTSVSNQNDVPKEFNLSQNYPNPFNPVTKITYSIPKAGIVKLAVYDILGHRVASLVNEYKNAGIYSVAFDGSRLSSGIYLYKLTSGQFASTKKMVLLK